MANAVRLPAVERAGGNRLALLLAMAMFVLVVDTSIMNVSISSVVHDLDTDVSSQPKAVRDEIIDINTDARPKALQVALLIPFIAGVLGFLTSFRMARLPDPEPSDSAAAAFG